MKNKLVFVSILSLVMLMSAGCVVGPKPPEVPMPPPVVPPPTTMPVPVPQAVIGPDGRPLGVEETVVVEGPDELKDEGNEQEAVVQKPAGEDGVACTQDAKICPDGSGVGRTGPNCEFAPCPTAEAKKPAEPVAPAPVTKVEPQPAPAEATVVEIQITAKQWEFVPSALKVRKGDKVRLVVTSVDVTHGLSLPEFGVNLNIEAGKTATVEFVADKAGTFTFYCSVPCGSGHGSMRGTLMVE